MQQAAPGSIAGQREKARDRLAPRLKMPPHFTAFDPYTANLDHAQGRDPKRSPATTESFPLEAQTLLPALRARRMDRPGRLEGDNDIVERYKNPSKELALPRAV